MIIEKRKRAFIESVLNLINADLENLGQEAKIELAQIFKPTVTGFPRPYSALSEFSYEKSPEQMISAFQKLDAELSQCRTALKEFFETMMSAKRKQKSEEETFRKRIKGKAYSTQSLSSILITREHLIYLEYMSDSSEGAYSSLLHPWPLGPEEKYRIKVHSICLTNESRLVDEFILALDGMPISAFHQCEECKNWFLHSRERERRFCSSRCRARKGSRESYKERKKKNPEAYESMMVKNRKRAEDSYRRRMKEKTQTPGIIIGKKTSRSPKEED